MMMITSMIGFAYDCKNARALADFYASLLNLKITLSGDGWAGIHTPQGIILAFQTVQEYVPPVWPWKPGAQQQMAHIDFKVDNLTEAVNHAIKCGATKAEEQYYDTSTVMIDPEGHPFCLSTVQQ